LEEENLMPRRPNFLIVITDQQSGNPYWPEGWEEENLPAMRWLREHGISFSRAYTNSCTCSPARVTMLTGLYPAQHGVTEVLEFDNIASIQEDIAETGGTGMAQQLALNVKERRQRAMPSNLQNLAKILKTADYNVVYKGKWHLTKPANYVKDPAHDIDQKYWTEADVQQLAERWGFDGWTMPDAGDNLAIANMGGGTTNNDQRFVDGHGQAAKYGDVPYEKLELASVLHFLKTYDSEKPFCLIVSLVNPHDVLAYPGSGVVAVDGSPLYQAAGYRDEDFMDLPIDRPPTWNEDLSTKPLAQTQFRVVSNAGTGLITADDEETQLGYCRFYAYLCKVVDQQILQILEALQQAPFFDDTVIVRISDHGDMAMAHGLQRQKMFNTYEETLNIPFIVSGPERMCGKSDALVSLIDLLPTLANLAGVPDLDRWIFKGRDLSPILSNPNAEVQGYIHFTYEDLYFYAPAANHIRAIVEKRWKYAVYFDVFMDAPFEYEMYDLDVPRDQREVVNLAHPSTQVSEEVATERERLHQKLIHIMETLGTTPLGIIWPEHWGDQRSEGGFS
jgi:arylsulfatase A-like enzyme